MASPSGRRSVMNLLFALLGLLLAFLMPTNQSLWIDESNTALYARQPTIRGFLDRMKTEIGSDAQMPLGNLYYWAGAKFVGDSEVSLRFLSSFWIMAATLIFWRIGIHTRMPFLPSLLACNAFLWFYGGEVRPYAMQIALGSGLLYSSVIIRSPSGNIRLGMSALLICGTMLCATSMLGVLPFTVVAAAVGTALVRQRWKPHLWDWISILTAGLFTIILGSYYAWTLSQGKGAQTLGTWGVGLKNLAFAAYEILGFAGFGPGRYELRELGLARGIPGALDGFTHPFTVGAVLLALLYMWAGLRVLRVARTDGWSTLRLGALAAAVAATSTGCLLVLSLAVGFPFWGRHLAPVFPFLAFAVGVAVDPRRSGGRVPFLLPLLLCATLFASSLLIRFHPRHIRDDYRSAARIAQANSLGGRTVWWSASHLPALYYGVTICEPVEWVNTPCVLNVVNASEADLSAYPRPDLVVASKPDLYDGTGALRRYVEHNRYEVEERLTAFELLAPR